MNECSVSTVSKLIQICWQSFSETDTESRLHWSNQMVGNWNVQRAEISNLSENNLVTALSIGPLTLLELVMSRSHQSSWKILFDGSTRIKSLYKTLNSRNFWYSTGFFSYPPNWTKLDLTFILNNYQSFRSNRSSSVAFHKVRENLKLAKKGKKFLHNTYVCSLNFSFGNIQASLGKILDSWFHRREKLWFDWNSLS